MSDAIITVENLGKKYRIRHQQERGYVALRDVIAAKLKAPLSRLRQNSHATRPEVEDFWALKDVSFSVKQGEVVGIIGRNGAGKSTLLKILSRITEPTEGRVTLRGRVASLLEVGTGFHPELTGRENIFLNGAILGMTRTEITKKFDEIVAFAEVQKFLDTPVKRYSSGMYVRLAFAVAAHLEPEVLIVDEVLAVGDAEFQRKCLGKMRAVATGEGRTVLFVSHNMQAVQSLCTRAVLLDAGRISTIGAVSPVVSRYFAVARGAGPERTWTESDAPGNADLKLTGVRVLSGGEPVQSVATNKLPLHVELTFFARISNPGLCVGFDLANSEGVTVLRTYQTDQSPDRWPTLKQGQNQWRCELPQGLLNAGRYYICPRIGIHNVNWVVNIDAVVAFDILLDHGESPLWNSLNGTSRPGLVAPILQWQRVGALTPASPGPWGSSKTLV